MKTIWTFELLQEIVNTCSIRYDLQKKSSGGYSYARKNNLLDELFKNHPNNGYFSKKHEEWTIDKLQEKANIYLTRSEFWEKEPGAASIASNRKLIDELFKNHINNGYTNRQVVEGYWTKEQLQIEADKFSTRGLFRINNFKAYHSASSKNLLDELFKNHDNKGYKNNDKYCENNYVIYVYEFKELNNVYVGLTNNIIRRDKQHIWGNNENMSIFCKENKIALPKYKIIEKNLKSSEAQEKEIYWVNFYKNNNWKILNIAKPGSLGGNVIKWTKNKLKKITDTCENRRDFRKKYSAAYGTAIRLKLMDELFKNHPNQGFKSVPNSYWTKEKIQEEAIRYKTRSNLNNNNGSAYNAALKMNILNEIFEKTPNNGYAKRIRLKWTNVNLQKLVNQYKNRIDFSKNNELAYNAAIKHNMLDELFKNHANQGYIRNYIVEKIKKSE